jgi:hypothetical protein
LGVFGTVLTEGSMQDTSRLQDYLVQEYRLPSPPSIKCNVLRESLSEDSQTIPCAILKRRWSWEISYKSLGNTFPAATDFPAGAAAALPAGAAAALLGGGPAPPVG